MLCCCERERGIRRGRQNISKVKIEIGRRLKSGFTRDNEILLPRHRSVCSRASTLCFLCVCVCEEGVNPFDVKGTRGRDEVTLNATDTCGA